MPKLLLVDDTPTNLLLIQRRIQRHLPDCEILLASSPEEALQIAAQDEPDCAILDLYMPRFNGIELARALKSRSDHAGFPVLIVTSGDSDAPLRVQALEAGADDFIDRKSTEPELISKVRVMLRIKRAEDELRTANRRLAQLAGERSTELYESAERFQTLFENSSDLVLVLEMDSANSAGRVVAANPAACHHLSYAREELLRLPPHGIFSRDFAAQWPMRLQAIIKHRETCFDAVLLRRTGHTVAVTAYAHVIDTGERRTILLTCQRSGRSKGSPEDSGRRYRLIASQTGQIIYEVRIAEMRLSVSGALMQITGRPAESLESLQGGKWSELIHPDDKEEVQAVFRDALKNLGKYHMQWRLQHVDGTYRHVEDLGVVLPGEDGKAMCVLGTLRDITRRVEAEEERQRAEQMEQHTRKLESLGVLAGGIAHDFNNILAAIIGLTDMALQDITPGSTLHEDLSEVLKAGHRAKDLVKQILKFSRQEQEDRRPVFLHQIVREALKLLRATIPPHIEIIDAVDIMSGQVLASAAQMHQIIMNYCANAAHSVGTQPGTIEVWLRDVDVDERMAALNPQLRPGPYVKLSVIDTGHGMDERIKARMFDPFFTTKPVGEGTGMGLAVVHGIVSSHGGAILVDSKPGQGAAFHTFLPRVQLFAEAPPEPVPTPVKGKERILFVDDEDAVLRFAQAALEPMGYSVTLCEDPVTALTLFSDAPAEFDLLVTDLMMPKMMGDALAEAVHKVRPELPVVLFTGFGDFVTAERLAQVGVGEIVHKPIIARDLAEALRRALAGTEDRDSAISAPVIR